MHFPVVEDMHWPYLQPDLAFTSLN